MPMPEERRHTREDSGIRLDRALNWWHDGIRIEHPKIIEAFHRGIMLREDGRFELRFGNDWCLIEVEDAAYWVRQIEVRPNEGVMLLLSDQTEERLNIASLRLDEEVLTCDVKQGRAKARFSREAQFSLGERMDVSPRGTVLRLNDQVIDLPLPLS